MDNNKIEMISSWNDVSTEMFQEIYLAKPSNFDSIYMYKLEMFSILADVDVDDEEFDELEADEVFEALEKISFIEKDPTSNNKKVIGEYTFREYNDQYNPLTLAEFISLEYYFSKDFVKNLHQICAIMYRKTTTDQFNNIVFEKHGTYNAKERSKEFENLKITDVFGVISKFIQFKAAFVKAYYQLFEPADGAISEEEMYKGLEEWEIYELKKELERDKALAVFNWERVLDEMTGGDITKQEAVYDLPLYQVFNKRLYDHMMKLRASGK